MSNQIKLKGRYLVADPCSLTDDATLWETFTDQLTADGLSVVPTTGGSIYVMPTAHGDGFFPVFENGQCVGEVTVDTGLVALIPWGTRGEPTKDEVVLDLEGELVWKDGNTFVGGSLLVLTGLFAFDFGIES